MYLLTQSSYHRYAFHSAHSADRNDIIAEPNSANTQTSTCTYTCKSPNRKFSSPYPIHEKKFENSSLQAISTVHASSQNRQ